MSRKIERQLQVTPAWMRSKDFSGKEVHRHNLRGGVLGEDLLHVLKRRSFQGHKQEFGVLWDKISEFPVTTHGDQRTDPNQLPEKAQGFSTANHGYNELLSSSEAAAHP